MYNQVFKFYKSNRNQLSDYIGEAIVEENESVKINVFDSNNKEIVKEGIKSIDKDFIIDKIYIKGNYYWIIKDVDKEEILSKIEINQESTKDRNLMSCSENWYNPFYSVRETFNKDELEKMSKEELINLLRLATVISEGLY